MRYERPQTIEDATALLAGGAGKSYVLAGGTDLLVRMQNDAFEADLIVDIKGIDGMGDIRRTNGDFVIGAGVPCAQLEETADLVAAWPGVVEGANLIGSTQIQGRCTVVGNLCNASPAADSVPAMVAADARVRIAGPDGTREAAILDIPTGPGKTSLGAGEIIEAVILPARPARSSDAYLRFTPRTEMDIAVVGVGVNLTLDDSGIITAARVALGAVGPKVMLVDAAAEAIIGTKLDDAALDALGEAASAAASPIDDKRGTVAFRKQVAGVLTRRAAQTAYTRAGGK
ncbi:MAG: xanthine dehydrogenase family protein subunit M [Pseudomonadota bacterium]